MSFLNKVKSIKNAITGGAAKVYIDSSPITFGEPFDIIIRAQVDDSDLKIDRVYLEIEGREEVEVPDTDVIYENNGEQHRRTEIVRARTVTMELEITVADAQVLSANEGYEWVVTVELPDNALPEYRGRFCQHTYIACAALDCFGNDPDSGWVELNMS